MTGAPGKEITLCLTVLLLLSACAGGKTAPPTQSPTAGRRGEPTALEATSTPAPTLASTPPTAAPAATATPDLPATPIGLENADQMVALHTWPVSDSPLTALAFSPDGSRLAVGDGDGRVSLLDPSSGEVRRQLYVETSDRGPAFSQLVFHPDGQRLFSVHANGWINHWDPSTGQHLLQQAWERSTPLSLAISPDFALVAASTPSGGLELWDIGGGEPLRTVGEKIASHVTFSPDGKFLVACGAIPLERFLEVYPADGSGIVSRAEDLQSMGLQRTLFSPQGRQLAGQWGQTLSFYAFSAGKLTFTGDVNPPPEGGGPAFARLHGLAYHPQGEIVANNSIDPEREYAYQVLLWDVETLSKLAALDVQDRVQVLAFSPDALTLLGGTDQGDLIVWGLT